MSALDTELLCRDERRRALLLEHPDLNGIDHVEYDEFPALPPAQRYRLSLTFIKPPPSLDGAAVTIAGGVRRTGIRALAGPLGLAAEPPNTLVVQLDGSGDFSDYVVTVRHPELDGPLASAPFSFKAGCPSELDCLRPVPCEPEPVAEPRLDYQAKDYASFRRLMLDLAASRNPRWREANAADLGTVLVELLAWRGDELSWAQDAVATEAFLETCGLRISARRHARLVDYRMHDGRNAFGFVVLEAAAGSSSTAAVPAGTRFLTRLRQPLRGATGTPGPVIATLAESAFDDDPALREALVFEAVTETPVRPSRNRLFLHERGDLECCLPKGATRALLYGLGPATMTAEAPDLEVGDWLLLETVKGVETGLAVDVDPALRQVVRLTEVSRSAPAGTGPLVDPLFKAALGGTPDEPLLQPIKAGEAGVPALPLAEIAWDAADALRFPLRLSTVTARGEAIAHIAVARGNVVPVDHGRTVTLPLGDIPAEPEGFARAARLRLRLAPLTVAPGHGLPPVLDQGPRDCLPAVSLTMTLPGAPPTVWQAVPDLLDSGPFEEHFVAEIDDAGIATLRFGDGTHGRSAAGATAVVATARLGNGSIGNVGRDAIAHAVFSAPGVDYPTLAAIRQPLAATHGQEPEGIAEVRERAGAAMRAVQLRAVTEADWQARAMAVPGVADARASFRWTGSWHTVFVALHPADPDDLVPLPGGGQGLTASFRARAMASLGRVRLAGYDLALGTATYVPLRLGIRLCVAPGHFRGAVLQAVGEALANRRFADGRVGLFHLSRLRFAASVRSSRIIAAVQAVPGVASLELMAFERYWDGPNDELETGHLPLDPFEIARLDNDPSQPENGVLELSAVGGL